MARFHISSILLFTKIFVAYAASKNGSVRIYPNVEQNARSISFPELNGIVSHFTGVSSSEASYAAINDKAIVNAASDVFEQPKANLLLSVEGVESESLSNDASYVIPSSDLLNSESLAEFELDMGYKVANAQGSESMVVLLSNEKNECKEGEYKTNVVRVVVKEDDVSLTGHPYNVARKAIKNIQKDKISERFNELYKKSDAFDGKKYADKIFMSEMVYMHDILNKINDNASKFVKDENKDFYGIVSDGAKQIFNEYGETSEQYKAAKEIVKETVDYVVKQFQTMYANGVAEVITTPVTKTNKRSFMVKRADKVSNSCQRANNYSLFSSEKEAQDATNNCNGRGKVTESKVNPHCFYCACSKNETTHVQYGGDSCEAEEISSQFNLLLWTAVILIVILLFTLGLLLNIKSDIQMVGPVSTHTKSD